MGAVAALSCLSGAIGIPNSAIASMQFFQGPIVTVVPGPAGSVSDSTLDRRSGQISHPRHHVFTPEEQVAISKIQDFERLAKKAMDEDRFSDFLAIHDQELAVELGPKRKTRYHDPRELESYFQLKNYQQVTEVADRNSLCTPESITALGISLIRLGRLQEARNLYTPRLFIVKDVYDGCDTPFLPDPKDAVSLECCFRLVRGINQYFHADSHHAIIELQEADRLIPHSPLTSFYLGASLKDMDRVAEAKKYMLDAIKLGSGHGSRADEFDKPWPHRATQTPKP